MQKGVTIHLKRMQFYAFHGVLPQEQIVGAEYVVSIRLKLSDMKNIIFSDDISNTVNYAEVHNMVQNEMNVSSQLLEHVAGRIIKRLFSDFPLISEAEVEISKIAPPMKAQMHEVSVCIGASREDL